MMPFSVSETSKVVFSPGNLQYQPSTGIWRFAENQYDLVDANTDRHETTIYIADYDGWIDLFGWGTSGWTEGGAIAYQPYSTSISNFDYCHNSYNNINLTGWYAKADWGVYNAIENGGKLANEWRTLTAEEWQYLFNRKDASDNVKCGAACVAGVNGMILLPDEWTLPEGLTFNFGFHSEHGREYFAQKNNFTAGQWAKLETAGAVFLPAAGVRRASEVSSVGLYGGYWSSSGRSNYAYYCGVGSNGYEADRAYDLCGGLSVRLVRDM